MTPDPQNIDLLTAYTTLIKAYMRTHAPPHSAGCTSVATEEAKHE